MLLMAFQKDFSVRETKDHKESDIIFLSTPVLTEYPSKQAECSD